MNTSDYTYVLPPEKIATHPLSQRDNSRLLVYKEREIFHAGFQSLPEFLPSNAFLFFNNTKVIPARLHFQKACGTTSGNVSPGAVIEVFLLSPVAPSTLLTETMGAVGSCAWLCTVGKLKKWTEGMVLQKPLPDGTVLRARLKAREEGLVEFTWDSAQSFAEIIQRAGETPLPPYIKRKPEAVDRERYQTIYSHHDGAVAAPTAGLHFTPAVFEKLADRKVRHDFLTLHVSAGTFQPIKTENPEEHIMHEEQVIVNRTNLANLTTPGNLIIAVGTTSMRTLESIYWFGAKLLTNPESEFVIAQDEPYEYRNPPTKLDAFRAVAAYMERHQTDRLVGETSIFIRPGYTFRVCEGLVTNFHQPGSTLILLVAAFVGPDWKTIYGHALERNYRFLSYGDSSLLLPTFSRDPAYTAFT